jgi:pimeloyl-ACP methyl ester carboxylesterase
LIGTGDMVFGTRVQADVCIQRGAARRRRHRKGFIPDERDMMTPARAGKALVAALPNSRTVVLRGAGHMMMVERPDELFEALRG